MIKDLTKKEWALWIGSIGTILTANILYHPSAKYFMIAKYSEKCYNISRRRDIVVSSDLFSLCYRQMPLVPRFLEFIS